MSTRRRVLLAGAVCALLLGTSAPAWAGDVPAPSGAASTVDVTGDWQGARKLVKQTVTFDENGTVSGDAGCNSFSGTYSVKGSTIRIGTLAATLKLCDDATMDAEQAFLAKLQTARHAKRSCSVLVLKGADGTLRLTVFTEPGQPVPVCAGSPANARP